MAQNLTHTEARNYPLSNGTTVDLIALVSSVKPQSWVQATEVQPVGTVVYAYAMGELRRGVVVKNTPTKTMVALTTAAAAAPGGTVRVQTATELHTTVYVAPAPVVETPAETPAEAPAAAPEFNPEAGATAPEANRAASQTGGVVARPLVGAERALETQRLGRVLRMPELTFQLPSLGGRELIRIADLPDLSPLTLHRQACKVDNMNNASDTQTPAQTETTPAERHTGSTVVKLIERVWDRIRADHPELPEVVVTTGSGEGVKWGHFRPESWKLAEAEGRLHEFFLASEALAKGPAQVLQTTIHEAAHTLSKARGIKDTSRQGRWHNAAFKKAAEELGLEHKAASADKSHGFSFVTLTAATKAKYADLLAELEQELKLTGLLPLWMGGSDQDEDERGGEKITGKPTKTEGEGETKSGPVKAVCDCEEPVIIRISQKVMDMGVVRCDGCESLFHRP
jgi:hypothetical protein